MSISAADEPVKPCPNCPGFLEAHYPGCLYKPPSVDEKLDTILEFMEELRPMLDMAKTFMGGTKSEKLRAMIRNGR